MGAFSRTAAPPSDICMRSGARMRDSCRWPTIGGILRFHGGSPFTGLLWRCPVLGPVIFAASRSDRMRRLISAAPVTRPVVDRFIPGETVDDVVPVIEELTGKGLDVTMDVVGEDITTPAQAEAARDAYLELVDRLG